MESWPFSNADFRQDNWKGKIMPPSALTPCPRPGGGAGVTIESISSLLGSEFSVVGGKIVIREFSPESLSPSLWIKGETAPLETPIDTLTNYGSSGNNPVLVGGTSSAGYVDGRIGVLFSPDTTFDVPFPMPGASQDDGFSVFWVSKLFSGGGAAIGVVPSNNQPGGWLFEDWYEDDGMQIWIPSSPYAHIHSDFASSAKIYGIIYDGVSVTLYRNNTEKSTSQVQLPFPRNVLSIGAGGGHPGIEGIVHEMVFIPRVISQQENAFLRRYLAERWLI